MKNFIENISQKDVATGNHGNIPKYTVLIQICNPGSQCVKPLHEFDEIHQFEILDAEDKDLEFSEEVKFTDSQAKQIVDILLRAIETGRDVTVHCHMGVSRSGAVALIGEMMGFVIHKNCVQIPNLRMVKLMKDNLPIYLQANSYK